MAPCPRSLVVVQVAQRAALSAPPLDSNRMAKINVNLPLFQFQFHAFDKPRIGDPENLSIKLSVLNGSSPRGAFPLNFYSAWRRIGQCWEATRAPHRGQRPRRGVSIGTPFRILPRSLRISTPPSTSGLAQCDKSRGSRGWPPGSILLYPLRTRNSRKTRILSLVAQMHL